MVSTARRFVSIKYLRELRQGGKIAVLERRMNSLHIAVHEKQDGSLKVIQYVTLSDRASTTAFA